MSPITSVSPSSKPSPPQVTYPRLRGYHGGGLVAAPQTPGRIVLSQTS